MKKILPLLLFFIPQVMYAQQDPLLSQYQFNQLPINPAYTGVNDVTSFDLKYRRQWSGVDGAPSTVVISGQSSLAGNKLGLGVSLVHDKIGIIKSTELNITYGYELKVANDITFSFGLQTGFMSINYDYNDLTLEDLTDEDFINASDGLNKVNFGTGLFLSSEKFYVGLSIPRMLKVTEEVGENTGERYNRHYYLTAGLIFDSFQAIKLKPYTVIRQAEGSPLTIDAGAMALFADIFWAGLFTRDFNDFGLTTSLNLDNGLRIGYSGELTSNEVPSSSLSSHEISIGIDFEWFENQAVVRRYY